MTSKNKFVRKLGIVTSPLQLDEQDTFFLFVNEAISRPGLEVFVFDAVDLTDDGEVMVTEISRPISFKTRASLGRERVVMKLSDFDMVFLKKDPPIDEFYKNLLKRLVEEKIPAVNKPVGLLKMGSKAYLKHFPLLTPRTFYIHKAKDAVKYLKIIGNCVIKKSDSSGGKGVSHIRYKFGAFYGYRSKKEVVLAEAEVIKIVENYLENSIDNTVLVVEYFLSAPERGDKRVVILDGNILGSYIRLPNLKTGLCVCGNNGAKLCDPTKRDKEIVKMLRPHLKKYGIELAALDLLISKDGMEHLSEINVFNPGFCNLDVVHPELNVAKKIIDMLCRMMREGD